MNKEAEPSQPKFRMQFDVSQATKDRLDSLKELAEETTYAKIFANALQLYEALVHEVDNGTEFFTKNKKGEFVPYQMFK